MGEPGVGRMRDRLLLYSGIYRNPFEIFGVDRPGAVGHREALLQQRDDLLLTQPLAPARERRAIKWQLVPEHHLPTEVLEIRVLHPSLAQRLVGEVVHMLENEQPGHQPRRQRRLPGSHPTHRAEASRQKVPIDLPRQPHQRNLTVSTAGKSAQERSEWDDRFMRRVWLRLSSSSRAGADRVFGYCDR